MIIGDVVSWDYRGKAKTGTIAAVIQPGVKPRGWKGLNVEAAVRDHVSYVVASEGKHYFPRVNVLRKLDEGEERLSGLRDHFCRDLSNRDRRQEAVFSWAQEAFGTAEATSLTQRGLRLLEETIEAYQAVGGDQELAHTLIDFVFSRPVGTLPQELGGVGVTTLALAAAAGLSAEACELCEVERVLAKPLEEMRKRNEAKNAAGLRAGEKRPKETS